MIQFAFGVYPPGNDSTYPTKREVRKIILWGYVGLWWRYFYFMLLQDCYTKYIHTPVSSAVPVFRLTVVQEPWLCIYIYIPTSKDQFRYN